MDWLIWAWGVIHGVVFSIVVLPFAVKWIIKKKLKKITGGFLQ